MLASSRALTTRDPPRLGDDITIMLPRQVRLTREFAVLYPLYRGPDDNTTELRWRLSEKLACLLLTEGLVGYEGSLRFETMLRLPEGITYLRARILAYKWPKGGE